MRMMSQEEEDDEVGRRTRRSAGSNPKTKSPTQCCEEKNKPTKHSQQEPNTTPKRHQKTPRTEPPLAGNKKPLKKPAHTHTQKKKHTHTHKTTKTSPSRPSTLETGPKTQLKLHKHRRKHGKYQNAEQTPGHHEDIISATPPPSTSKLHQQDNSTPAHRTPLMCSKCLTCHTKLPAVQLRHWA